jgi:two-component system, sensor histidine kinase LadS
MGSALLFGPAVVAAQDLIKERGFWEDSSAQAGLETAVRQTYTPFTGVLSRGYSASAHWILLEIPAHGAPLGLRILPSWLDQITLHDPDTGAAPVTLGDRFPEATGLFHGPGHSFELAPHPQPRRIWLRVQSTSSHFVNAEVLTLDRFGAANTQRMIWSVVYVTLLVFLFLLLMPIWWTQRDQLLGRFLLKHAVYIYYGAAYLGLPPLLLSDWLPPVFFDRAFVFSVLLVTPLILRFDCALLAQYNPWPLWLNLLKAVSWVSVGNLLFMVAGYTSQALELNLQIILGASLVVMLAVVSVRPEAVIEQLMPKKVVVIYYLIIVCSLPLGLISLLGWVDPREWSLYVLILHGLIAGVFMAGVLFVRVQRQTAQHQQVRWQLDRTREDMALEQRRRQEQSQFLHMLMHELKTPLSVVALALGTRGQQQKNLDLASRAVQDMKAILDRCVQADKLGEVALDLRSEEIDLAALVNNSAAATPRLNERYALQVQGSTRVCSDRQLLKIVLNNLLDNAARYSDPVTLVRVDLHSVVHGKQAGVAVHVANTPGLAGWPDAQQVFSKYYRSAGAQRDSGSGLGLFLAQQLATNLGGSLQYRPTPLAVEFVLWIPQTPA